MGHTVVITEIKISFNLKAESAFVVEGVRTELGYTVIKSVV